MQVPLEISTRWIDLSPPLEAEIRKRAGRLERRFSRITSCRIAVERPTGNHHQEGGPYRVRLDITVPGSELVADKEAEEIYTAIRDAFEAAERQVEEWSRRRRGEVKSPVLPPEGQVVRIFPEEGFGFIAGPDGEEVYFHRNAVLDPPGFDKLEVGSRVRFAQEQGFEGPQASTVSVTGKEA
ncbi:MAG TPA: HPF/RaiA family ribosome-associated protein [Thermoanaerobaculia bacterium]|jgi:ribosomal subunit interface protein|nr:HPF/RaiA family ribosome-associated protein [Thermoanaerobaculia bacterium]